MNSAIKLPAIVDQCEYLRFATQLLNTHPDKRFSVHGTRNDKKGNSAKRAMIFSSCLLYKPENDLSFSNVYRVVKLIRRLLTVTGEACASLALVIVGADGDLSSSEASTLSALDSKLLDLAYFEPLATGVVSSGDFELDDAAVTSADLTDQSETLKASVPVALDAVATEAFSPPQAFVPAASEGTGTKV